MMKLALALLLALASTSAAATTVTINGTAGNDTIYVGVLQTKNVVTGKWTTVGPRKIVNGVVSVIVASFTGVADIDVVAGGGNDYVEIVNSTYGNFTISATQRLSAWVLSSVDFDVYGGEGDDQVLGSDFGDYIAGGLGDDDLVGAGGSDMIVGNDLISGSEDLRCDGLYASILAGDIDYCSGDLGDSDSVTCYPESYGGPGINDSCSNGGAWAYPASCESGNACYFE